MPQKVAASSSHAAIPDWKQFQPSALNGKHVGAGSGAEAGSRAAILV